MGLTYLWATFPSFVFPHLLPVPSDKPFERRAPRSMLEFVIVTQAFPCVASRPALVVNKAKIYLALLVIDKRASKHHVHRFLELGLGLHSSPLMP